MKQSPHWLAGCLLAGLVFGDGELSAADFTVTSPGSFYSISSNGVALPGTNPTLTLERGRTYTFAISTSSFHPFQITNAPAGTVTGANNSSSGIITFAVPSTNVNVGYHCSIHNFGAAIVTVAPGPPPPPVVQIFSLVLDTNITLRSSGTNTWSVIPEFNTNLATTNWAAMIVQTNRFSLGTNETICGRPPGDSVFIRIRSQPN